MAKSPAVLLQEIYKASEMSIYSIDMIHDKSPNKDLNNELAVEKSKYQTYSDTAKTLLEILGEKPIDVSFMTKTSASAGIMAKTLFKKDASHIASLMIEGTTMGIVDLTKAFDGFGNQDQAVSELCSDILKFQEQSIDRLKSYL